MQSTTSSLSPAGLPLAFRFLPLPALPADTRMSQLIAGSCLTSVLLGCADVPGKAQKSSRVQQTQWRESACAVALLSQSWPSPLQTHRTAWRPQCLSLQRLLAPCTATDLQHFSSRQTQLRGPPLRGPPSLQWDPGASPSLSHRQSATTCQMPHPGHAPLQQATGHPHQAHPGSSQAPSPDTMLRAVPVRGRGGESRGERPQLLHM